MSVPTTIFIDTCIFDEMAYNFEAASVLAFLQSIAEVEITLLMPDPTKKEVNRHLVERAKIAFSTLGSIPRKFPAIVGLKGWPLEGSHGRPLMRELVLLGQRSLQDFLKRFEVVNLKYEGIDIARIMEWYDHGVAPFSEKKRKEFPDAIALMAIANHQAKSRESVAIISSDGDFKAACERYSGLFYYPSLAAYSEALKGADARVEAIQKFLDENDEIVWNQVVDAFAESKFVFYYDQTAEVSEFEYWDTKESYYHVVGLGEQSCTVAFEYDVSYRATVEYEEGYGPESYTARGRVHERANVTGVVKLTANKDFTKLLDVENVELDEHEFTIREHPRELYY